VPVAVGHSEALHIEFDRPMSAREARQVLENAPGIVVVDDPLNRQYPQPIEAAGLDPVYVGRIRDDVSNPGGIALWVVADNVRKGAALNAVQIAELLYPSALSAPAAGRATATVTAR
jgi:aspartate-semialdehyde dehydrogenase